MSSPPPPGSGRSHPATGYLMETLTGSADGSIPGLLRGRAALTPDARFLRWEERWWTYAEALASCERVAGFLREITDVGPGHRVASYLHNCAEAIWTWFGTQLAGSVYVPLNRFHRGPLLTDLLTRSGADVLVTSSDALADIRGLSLSGVRHLVLIDEMPEEEPEVDTVPFEQVLQVTPWEGVVPAPDAIASVLFTSGSTGRSKAVLVPHNAFARGAALVAESFGYTADDIWHAWPPVFHMMGQLYIVLGSLAAGGGVALQPRFSKSRFWREVADSGATLIGGMASVMRLLWPLEDDEDSRANTARQALISGAFDDLRDAFQARYGVSIVDCYGMTEAEPATLPVLGQAGAGTHGLESPDFEVRIFDEGDLPVAAGVAGEIVLRPRRAGVVFRGYENDGGATVRAWRNLWFHTGDRGYLDADGHLHYLDRHSEVIRRLGENISVWEVEQLVHAVSGVADVVAIGVDGTPGEQDVKLVVVREPGAELTPQALHEWCRQEMAKFMVPRFIEFVDTFPRLALGKVDRARLSTNGPAVWDASPPSIAEVAAT
jgi:carnitine-CoA ligase